MRDFRDLICWQLSQQLKCEIVEWLKTDRVRRDFKFRDQIADASRSAPRNIAEGFGRFRPGDFAEFLGYARASLMETQNHLLDARDSLYIEDPLYSRLMNLAGAALRATTNLMRSKQRQAAARRRAARR